MIFIIIVNSTNDELLALNIKVNNKHKEDKKENKEKKDPKQIDNLSITKTKVKEIQIPKQRSQNNFPLSSISVSTTPISPSSNIGKRFERSPTKSEVNKKPLKSIDKLNDDLKKEKNVTIKQFNTKDDIIQKLMASKSPSNLKVIKRIELEAIKDDSKVGKIKPLRDISPQVMKKVINLNSERKVNSAKASKSPTKTTSTSVNNKHELKSVEINIDNQPERKISHIQIDITQDVVDPSTCN